MISTKIPDDEECDLGSWWLSDLYHSIGLFAVLSWTFWVFFSISLHELGHGWAAIWEGDDTPRRLGHMTWNPVVHMGMMSIVVFLLVGIAWGLMPVTPSRFRHGRKGDALVAVAGPVMNLIIAFVAVHALLIVTQFVMDGSGNPSETLRRVSYFFQKGAELNIVLFLLNLIPVPPLDGSRILGGLNYKAYEFYNHPDISNYSLFALIAIFALGVGSTLFGWANAAVVGYHNFVAHYI